MEMGKIDQATLKFWVSYHYGQYVKRLDHILEYLCDGYLKIDGNTIGGRNKVWVRQGK